MPENLTVFGRRHAWEAVFICAFMLLLLLVAGCSAPTAALPAAPVAQATTASATSGTAVSTATASASAPATATGEATASIEDAATPTPSGTPNTPVPRPTPANPPPADPVDVLNVFDVVTPGNLLIKRDLLPLDQAKPDNVLVTITGARLGINVPLTEENSSAIGVMTYDPVYREWNLTWQSDAITGTARPLAAANQFGGTNGADLLRDVSSILQLRTTTLDGAAHLMLFRYDRATHIATPLKMLADLNSTTEQDALFTADLDVNVADLDDDGVYEVVADNVTGVNTWRWDGSKYVPKVRR